MVPSLAGALRRCVSHENWPRLSTVPRIVDTHTITPPHSQLHTYRYLFVPLVPLLMAQYRTTIRNGREQGGKVEHMGQAMSELSVLEQA